LWHYDLSEPIVPISTRFRIGQSRAATIKDPLTGPAVMIDLAPACKDATVTDQLVGKRWWRRMGFRAGTIYLVLYNFDSLTRLLPGFKWADELWTNVWLVIVPWVGKHVLGISYSFSGVANGSGDKTFNYVELFCYVVLALIGGLIWFRFDRAGRRDPLIHDLLRVSVRYVLAASMFVYGLSKVFHLQMPEPGPGRLMEPYGESSPMGLLWTFMGHSAVYSFIAGAAEVLGGVLVLFRRTATLGALVIFAVMLNVTIMNFCFDVPAKLYASHLVLMAVFVMWTDLKRLANLLVFNQPAPAVDLAPRWFGHIVDGGSGPRWLAWIRTHLERAALVVKVSVLGWMLYSTLDSMLGGYVTSQKKSEFVGVYKVESFARNGHDVPLLITEEKLWHRMGVDSYGGIMALTVRTMNETARRFTLKVDPAKHTWEIAPRGHPRPKVTRFFFKRIGADLLLLEGPWDGENVSVQLRRLPSDHYLLMNRGFRWINEAPFNR
jgi:uncharacterized membrane protein YphA (DoxX/SURF4 family)